MGLTGRSTGRYAADTGTETEKRAKEETVAVLAGNPNVGKSTLFNQLTGMNQHTGNWPGKTVGNAWGYCRHGEADYLFVDIPGTYSLLARSAEEEAARDFLCFGEADAVIVVCDASCLERNLNLVLQILEFSSQVLVCVNLLDEAAKKKIYIDLEKLSEELGVPVIGCVAREKESVDRVLEALSLLIRKKNTQDEKEDDAISVRYAQEVEDAILLVDAAVPKQEQNERLRRWMSLHLLEGDGMLPEKILDHLKGADGWKDPAQEEKLLETVEEARTFLCGQGILEKELEERIAEPFVKRAEEIAQRTVRYENNRYRERERRIDALLTSKKTGYPLMLLLLAVTLWITIAGANYPSQLLTKGLFFVQDLLTDWFLAWNVPEWIHGVVVMGAYRVSAWVIAVMLPPMAIFFPLFTLLEDAGYLPRIAYNLDKPFQKCNACGKQGLTMCMGFGCNAAGVVGCRIIDSPRERLIAVLTNSFVPCNGRFPTLIVLSTMFFAGTAGALEASVVSAVCLTLLILLGIAMTFAVSRFLSGTVLKGIPSAFVLELPPYRRPQIGKVLIRSIFDRTLFVLRRAVLAAVPAGILIWVFANIEPGGISLLERGAALLDPFASLLGLDGVILLAFILGFPANEIVLPIILMAYLAQGSLIELGDLTEIKALFLLQGWDWRTAVCVMLFSLMHWPCSTTLLTIKKETGSWKWTLAAFLLPTIAGMAVCFLFFQITGYVF